MSKFKDTELEVMKVLWEHGPLSPPEIQKHFPHPIHNATLRSLLMLLVEKEHIQRDKVGKAYYYSAKTPKQKTMNNMVKRIIDVFCDGSPSELIAQLIQDETLSEDDLREIKKIANSKTRKPPNPRQKGPKP